MTWRGIVPRQSLTSLAEPFAGSAGFLQIVGKKKNFWVMDSGKDLLAWTGTALHPTLEKSPSVLETLLQMFDQWPPLVEYLIRATDPDAIVETGVFDREPVSQWGDGSRMTLLGDAAHPMRPSLGLGTTMAFQDGVVLAKVLKGIDLDDEEQLGAALYSYEQERIAITSPLQRQARQQGTASHADDRADSLKAGIEAALAARRQVSPQHQ